MTRIPERNSIRFFTIWLKLKLLSFPARMSLPPKIVWKLKGQCSSCEAYGHTFVVFGRVGETPRKSNVAGLSPKGDDPQMWVMGHYVPVPSDTGWTDGDLEDKYITSRYRVLMNKAQYDRVRCLYSSAAGQIDDLERGAIQLQRLRCRHRKIHGS